MIVIVDQSGNHEPAVEVDNLLATGFRCTAGIVTDRHELAVAHRHRGHDAVRRIHGMNTAVDERDFATVRTIAIALRTGGRHRWEGQRESKHRAGIKFSCSFRFEHCISSCIQPSDDFEQDGGPPFRARYTS